MLCKIIKKNKLPSSVVCYFSGYDKKSCKALLSKIYHLRQQGCQQELIGGFRNLLFLRPSG
jgi:hypothetical protein